MFDFNKCDNPKKQGNIGIGIAIAWFVKNGCTVSIPLTDCQEYDLVIDDINGKLYKVQVKTTTFKEFNTYKINLKTCGGNQSFNTIKKFDKTKVDLLFIVTCEGDMYLIPTNKITQTNCLKLGEKYQDCKVT
jgi:hypothetical protein